MELPFDDPPTPEELAAITRLTADQVAYVDEALLANVVDSWRKLARVVAEAMNATESELPEVPVVYFAQRAMALRDAGHVESQGDLRRMRYSEIRLPQGKLGAPTSGGQQFIQADTASQRDLTQG